MYNDYNKPVPMEKIIAILSYLTGGLIGFIWIIIAIFSKNVLRLFLRYHIYQSIFLSLVYFIFSIFITLLFGLLTFIPGIKNLVGLMQYLFAFPVIMSYSVIQIFIIGLTLYLIIGVLRDEFSYIPWVSDVIKYNIGR